MNLTSDGLPVSDQYRLVVGGSRHWEPSHQSISVFWGMQHEAGRRRPFVGMAIGPLVLQVGWLWQRSIKEAQVPP